MESEERPWIVAIGASGAEGLLDICALLGALPANLPAIVMVVLHRLWNRPTQLRAILARNCRLPIVIADQGERFEAGTVYIGEPAEHLTLAAHSFGALIDDPHCHYGGRTVDLLLKSVAAHAGERMIGVVLSGSLDDGSRGLAAIHHAGGLTMVLTPGRPPQRGMPENAIRYDGPIDLIRDPLRIAEGICAACSEIFDFGRPKIVRIAPVGGGLPRPNPVSPWGKRSVRVPLETLVDLTTQPENGMQKIPVVCIRPALNRAARRG